MVSYEVLYTKATKCTHWVVFTYLCNYLHEYIHTYVAVISNCILTSLLLIFISARTGMIFFKKRSHYVILCSSTDCLTETIFLYWQNNSYSISLLWSRKYSIPSSLFLCLLSKPPLQLRNKLSKEHILFSFGMSDFVLGCLLFIHLINKLLVIFSWVI